MAISDAYLEELRSKNDVENVISSYVTLRRRGRILTGLCPFHNEKTPSFTVYPETQSYYCFGCGAGGDVITFIKNINNLDYIEAVKQLADMSGMAPPESNFDNGLTKQRLRMFEINREAAKFFYKALYSPLGKNCLAYYRKRGLSDETIKHFGLGFAPENYNDGLYKHLKSLGYNDLELFQANIIRKNEKSYYDAFKNRAMFPIIDIRGNVIAFSGRRLNEDDPRKYVNTSDTLVFKKGSNLFALNFAKSSKREGLILCEGNMDVISLHQAGFDNAVAGLGTALTEEQASLISRYANTVYLCYDNDDAGQKAVDKALRIFSKTGIKIKVLHLQGGKDPDEIIKNCGADYFRSIIEGAANDIEFKLLNAQHNFDITTSDGKLNYLNAAVDILASLDNSLERDIYSSRLSELGVSKTAIDEQIARKRASNDRRKKKVDFENIRRSTVAPKDRHNPDRTLHPAAVRAEEQLLTNIIFSPDCYKSVKEKITADDFVSLVNGHIFKVVSERIENARSLDLTVVSQELTDDEAAVYSKLLTSSDTVGKTVKECEDCIKAIISEKHKNEQKRASDMSNDEFMEAFKQLGNK
ncbi:MAG: DNA primase [Ruminococcaceae bacterium]|jgi:DNA primase|nr:DNA primase [Oscillospiraceae bacterium]